MAPGGAPATTGYILVAVDAQSVPRTVHRRAGAAAAALQRSDGLWPTPVRPPIEASEFTATAVAFADWLRMEWTTPPQTRASVERATTLARDRAPSDTRTVCSGLFGLVWADGSKRRSVSPPGPRTIETQRPDGGWAQTDFRSERCGCPLARRCWPCERGGRRYQVPGVSCRGFEIPARNTARATDPGWSVALSPDPGLFRERLSAWRGPIHFGGRHELGRAGPVALAAGCEDRRTKIRHGSALTRQSPHPDQIQDIVRQ